MDKDNKKAQILLITLLVLTILSILTITLVVLNSRDVSQVKSNQKYDQAYSVIEDKVKDLIGNFGTYESSLSGLTSNPYNCVVFFSKYYTCQFTQISGETEFTDEVIVSNEKNYSDFQLFKDSPLDINLNGYRNSIDFYWEKTGVSVSEQASIEFILIYRDSGGLYHSKLDVYNPAGVYTSAPASSNPFIYSDNPSYPGNLFGKRINYSGAISASDVPVKLVVIPRMAKDNDSVLMNVKPSTISGYPDQVRVFKGKSYDPNDAQSPVVNIITQIPLYPQLDSLLDYALITNNDITLN